MNTLMKLGLGLLAATAAASSMAQRYQPFTCADVVLGTAYSACQTTRLLNNQEATLLAAVPSGWGVTGSLYMDTLAFTNEPGETVISFAAVTPTSTEFKASYELTFRQAVEGPFVLILDPTVVYTGVPGLTQLIYRFDNGVSASDTLSIDIKYSRHATRIPYAAVVGVTTPVPEPQTYALALAGLGVAGWAARRRQKAAALAAA
ncbi:PEP-CTERM sorting domain-containing protein [Aquabacterium sp. A3]|uniref:PEP-CTERM sorting domain-containing protein n=1 Tax=Aquabacterium sp. A3 TaxID=3132829 RepID=UPI003119A0A3